MRVYRKEKPPIITVIIILIFFTSRYFFLVLMAVLVLGAFNGLVFFPVLLVMLGPPAQLASLEDPLSLPPLTPQPSPARFKARPPPSKISPKISSGKTKLPPTTAVSSRPRRHNSDVSLSTIAEETNSHHSSNSCSDSYSSSSNSSCGGGEQLPGGTSVFLEPHITVETSSVPSSVRKRKTA